MKKNMILLLILIGMISCQQTETRKVETETRKAETKKDTVPKYYKRNYKAEEER